MILKELALKNFRSYNKLTIKFQKPVTVIIGPNGIGKTNILEAAYLLGTTKSFRGASDRDLVTWKENSYFVKGYFESKDNKSYELSIGFDKSGIKHFLVDKIKVDKAKDFFGKIAFVIFSPDDIQLINGAPNLRRRYLDSILSKVSSSKPHNYLKLLAKYNRVHKIKTTLLKKIKKNQASSKELEIWDKQFVEYSVFISRARTKFVETIKEKFAYYFNSISGSNERVQLELISGLGIKLTGDKLSNIVKITGQKILSFRQREISTGHPFLGAHKDDLLILHKGKNISKFASQGQKRALALALKLAEYDYIKNHRQGFPILLVDDVIAELDMDKKGYFLKELLRAKQVLVSATELKGFNDKLFSKESQLDVYQITNERLLEKYDINKK